MKNIVLFDTSIGSDNKGDEIIMNSIYSHLSPILSNGFYMTMPTHTPCFHIYQQRNKYKHYSFTKNADYKFICGTNILSPRMLRLKPNWNVNIFNCKCYVNSILCGVGSGGINNNNLPDIYTKELYKRILSNVYIHSVRDEKTKEYLKGIGLDAINTGCPTLWNLTSSFCSEIPIKKSSQVVFTLTSYKQNKCIDQSFIDILCKNYSKLYFWPQDINDNKYYMQLKKSKQIITISPNIKSISYVLSKNDIDYVGTRLHAGILAMQHKRRAIILIVDNRANDISETYSINTIPREDVGLLEEYINSKIVTNIGINEELIHTWKKQFF
jgi:polysaccharide pyruvyl transferase WcaK-like protein